MGAHDVRGELLGEHDAAAHRRRERRLALRAERRLELLRGEPEGVEIGGARDSRRAPERVRELGGGGLGLFDAFGVLGQAELDESSAQLADVSSPGTLLGDLAERGDRGRVTYESAVGDRPAALVKREPGPARLPGERAQVDALACAGLGGDDAVECLVRVREARRGLVGRAELLLERHRSNNSRVPAGQTARNREAQDIFAPLGPTYDRYARLLSFGQDPRWRRFLVSRIAAAPTDTVLDVACGTGAVALELVRSYGCSVVGVDQSEQMLAEARARIERAGEDGNIELMHARAESLPFPDAGFDALTVTYLLRYVDDPAATMRELARVVRPGGRLAMLEFHVPDNPLARAVWKAYVDVGLPLAGRLISPGWHRVGTFLGTSIRRFDARFDLAELWSGAGIRDVRTRRMSLGGGIVVWGTRGD